MTNDKVRGALENAKTALETSCADPRNWTDYRQSAIEDIHNALAYLDAPVSQLETYNGEEWEPLAMALAEDEHDDIHELIYTSEPMPEPWGEVWQKYEDEAKRMIELVRKHVPALSVDAPVSQPAGFVLVPIEPTKAMCDAAWRYGDIVKNIAPDPYYSYRAMIAAAQEKA